MRNVSAAFKEAAFSQQTDQAFISLLTFSGGNLPEPIYLTNDPYELLPIANVRGVVSNGIEFIYLPFEVYLPQSDETGVSRARLKIDNVDRRIVLAARTAGSDMNVQLQIVLSSDVDNVEINLENFRLSDVTYDAYALEGSLTKDYFGLEPFPSGRFTPSNFPGIF